MPQCKPEAKEASSVRKSVNGGQGLALQVAQGLVAEPWTVAPPGNRDALSGQQVCRVQGSGPCVACRAQPCHHLRSGLTDLTRDLDFELDPSILLPQWAHKSCEADDWFGSTRSSRHRDNHLDVGNKRSRAAWTPRSGCLSSSSHSCWNSHNCGHHEAASVICSAWLPSH